MTYDLFFFRLQLEILQLKCLTLVIHAKKKIGRETFMFSLFLNLLVLLEDYMS